MDFRGHGHPITATGLAEASAIVGVGSAELWTILAVETHGFGFLPDRRPQVLFERHIFHHLTKGRFDTSHPEVSNKVPGGYAGGAAEYTRVNAATKLDYEAALESASWGIGQILGFNCERAGFALVDDMVADMIRDEDAQLHAVATFIRNTDLTPALQRRDWNAFAAGYNGAAYQRDDYATRLAAANARYRAVLPDLTMRTAQVALCYLGFDPGPIDGVRGPRTRRALRTFQTQCRLHATGTLDPVTNAQLLATAFPQEGPT